MEGEEWVLLRGRATAKRKGGPIRGIDQGIRTEGRGCPIPRVGGRPRGFRLVECRKSTRGPGPAISPESQSASPQCVVFFREMRPEALPSILRLQIISRSTLTIWIALLHTICTRLKPRGDGPFRPPLSGILLNLFNLISFFCGVRSSLYGCARFSLSSQIESCC